jgi:hypothetical protein
MDPVNIPDTWLLRPDFLIWPPQRHRAVLWMLAHMAVYRTTNERTLNKHDYLDFLRRGRWKFHSLPARRRLVGNYLSILDRWRPDVCGGWEWIGDPVESEDARTVPVLTREAAPLTPIRCADVSHGSPRAQDEPEAPFYSSVNVTENDEDVCCGCVAQNKRMS